jgi:hypothetical protein
MAASASTPTTPGYRVHGLEAHATGSTAFIGSCAHATPSARGRSLGNDVRADVLKFYFGFQADADELSLAFEFQFHGQEVGVGGAGVGVVGDAGCLRQRLGGGDVAAEDGVEDGGGGVGRAGGRVRLVVTTSCCEALNADLSKWVRSGARLFAIYERFRS